MLQNQIENSVRTILVLNNISIMLQAFFYKCLSTTNKVIVVSNRNEGEYIEGSMRNQSKAGELPKQREKVSVHTALRFSFAPYWLKN